MVEWKPLTVNVIVFCVTEAEMPDHNLEPPRFSRRALERVLNDWPAIKAMLNSGVKDKPTT